MCTDPANRTVLRLLIGALGIRRARSCSSVELDLAHQGLASPAPPREHIVRDELVETPIKGGADMGAISSKSRTAPNVPRRPAPLACQ